MAPTAIAPKQAKDFKPEVPPDWCPGCGDYGVLTALQRACAELGLENNRVLVVSGIGCSSNLPGFFKSYGIHSLHGRALAVATGCKMANHDITVIATGGDGDGYGIGQGHFIHAMRRNIDITYIVMNNEIYGLTTGQTSPTSEFGMKTKSAPGGSLEPHLNPMALALAAGCGFVARGFSGEIKQLQQLYQEGIQYKGFALIDVFSPCVTFNKQNTFGWFKERVYKLEDTDHDPSDLNQAFARAQEWGEKIPIGILYRNPHPRPTLHEIEPALKDGPLVSQKAGLSADLRRKVYGKYL